MKKNDFVVSINEFYDEYDLRETTRGVYHDPEDKVAVATEGHIMMVSAEHYNKEYDGKVEDDGYVVTYKGTGNPVRFPSYKRVIPADDSMTRYKVNMKQLEKALKQQVYNAALYPDKLYGVLFGEFCCKADNAMLIYRFMMQHGLNEIMLGKREQSYRAAVVRTDDSRELIMIMPVVSLDYNKVAVEIEEQL